MGFDGKLLKFAVHFATRSLWRNKRRSLLTIATVTLSVGVIIVSNRYARAVVQLWEDGAADYGTAHAQIHAKGYLDHPDGLREELTLNDDTSALAALGNDREIEAYSKRLRFEGVISAGGKTIYFLGSAIDPATELKVSPKLFGGGNDVGEFVSSGKKYGINIGRGLAETLEVKVGDGAALLAQTLTGSINGVDCIVTGIIDLPVPDISKRAVFADLGYIQQSLRMPGKFTEVGIRLKDAGSVPEWVEANRARMAREGVQLSGWWEITPLIRRLEMIFDSVLGLIALLMFISAGISVLNIVFMMVAERTVEIGTLMAIGAKPGDIWIMFTIESAFIGIIGGVSGALLGNLVVVVISAIGVPFESPFSSGMLIAHPTMHLGVSVAVACAAIVICFIAAIRPARKASGVEPVTAFKGQIT